MDSLERPGACVEIQAQRLAMYDLARRLTDDYEKRILFTIKGGAGNYRAENFFDGQILADRFDVEKTNMI